MGKWTKIEEGLPQIGVPIIVTVKDNLQGMPNQLRYPVYYVKDSMNGKYCWKWLNGDMFYDLLPNVSNVIAWMYLPQPYEEIDELSC